MNAGGRSAGRPRLYIDRTAARRAANFRAAERAAAADIVQRSVMLPRAAWVVLRAARVTGERSDAETLARLILSTNALQR